MYIKFSTQTTIKVLLIERILYNIIFRRDFLQNVTQTPFVQSPL